MRQAAMLAGSLVLAVLTAGSSGCTGGGPEKAPPPRGFDVGELEMLENLSGARIFFGHQSVGANIMEGVEELLSEAGIDLAVSEGKSADLLAEPRFLHAKIGRNTRPETKMEEFAELMEGDLGERVDMAFFKFCYLDIDGGTDVEELFEAYVRCIERVRAARPGLQLVHVTVPLTVCQTGPRAWIKKLLGKAPGGYVENGRRNEYNRMLREKYGARGTLFDLATIEATGPDGEMEEYRVGDRTCTSLYPGYTNDGSHLDETGRRVVARELLLFLAGSIEKREAR